MFKIQRGNDKLISLYNSRTLSKFCEEFREITGNPIAA